MNQGNSARWKSYEEVATYLLNEFAREFGLERVEGKQGVVGLRSGTTWEIDAKGVLQDGRGFFIIEFRRYTTSRQKQKDAGALAYQIIDTGAEGAIIVTPLGLQEGAKHVAAAEKIVSVQLNEDSTQHEYVLRFLNKVMIGLQDTLCLTESVAIEVRDKQGNIIKRHAPK